MAKPWSLVKSAASLFLFLVLWCCIHEQCCALHSEASIGVLVRLHGLSGEYLGEGAERLAAAAVMAVHHVNNRNTSLVPDAESLLPENFRLSAEFRDSESTPSVGIGHVLSWSEQGRDLVVGSYRSAVTGPMSLAASVSKMPVISWGSTSSSLSDKNTYPTLSRVIPSDAVLSYGLVRFMGAMRWNRIAIIHIEDAWGTAFAQDTVTFALGAGIEVASSQKFFGGDGAAMDEAVRRVQESGARIILVIIFDSDMLVFLEAAERYGLLEPGHVIISSDGFDPETVLQMSPERQKTIAQMSGWFLVSMDAMFGPRGKRFNEVLHNEPLEHLQNPLFLTDKQAITGGSCSQFCPLIYDAIWAASIAKSLARSFPDGAVDKDDMLVKLRGLSFNGASGPVNFEADTGERGAGEIPMVIANMQPGEGVDGTERLVSVPTWVWTQVSGLRQEAVSPPLWFGGERTWTLPVTGVECEDDSVFSLTTFRCEPCPSRTAKENGECVPYDAGIGLFVRLRGLAGEYLGDDWARLAAAGAMAVHHVNSRNSSLVPGALSLLPEGFKMSVDIRDTQSGPSVSIGHTLDWSDEGRDLVVGSYRSAVTGPMALAASVSNTPVLSWGATASSLADTGTYPTLGRMVPSDAVVSQGMVRFVEEMGWTRIAILYLDDAWGRAFAQDTAFFASQSGIQVATMQKFIPGDAQGISNAVQRVAESLARILVILVFDSDMPVFIQEAKSASILQEGYVIISGEAFEPNAVVSQSSDPSQMIQDMSGWFRVSMNAMYGARGERFNQVLHSEPLEHMQHPLFPLTEDVVRGGPCQQYCPLIYDSVWAAAIAASRTEANADGTLLKPELLQQLRELTFDGSSGPVAFDTITGERGTSEIPMVVVNLQPGVAADGSNILKSEVAWIWTQVSGLQRESLEPPLWLGGTRSWDDVPSDGASCGAGYIFSPELLECIVCAAGKFQSEQQCVECPAGTVSALNASTQCAPCQAGYQELPGQTQCTPCPQHSARRIASLGISVTECMCETGFFRRGAPGTACEACVTGAECVGGDSMPHPLKGFWGDKECAQFGFEDKECSKWDLFLPCPNANCAGGADFACQNGGDGRLCSGAEEGFSIIGGLFWWECGKNGHLLTAVGMLAVVVVWFAINHVASGEYDALNVALLFLQITGLISTYGLKWHKNLEPLNIALNIANFDVDFVSPYCFFPWRQSMAFYLQLLLPFVFGFLYALFFAAWEGWRRYRGQEASKFGIASQVMRSVMSFILIVYHTQVLKCFAAFGCSEYPDGRKFLTVSPEIECWKGEHWGMVVTAIVYIPVVLVGLPALLVWEIFKHMHASTLHTEEAMFRWGFVHQHYETDVKYWEAVIILRRLLIAGIAVTISEPMLQGACAMIVLTALLAAHTFHSPYVAASIDLLDFSSICGSMLYALAGLLMYPNLTAQAQNQVCVEDSESQFCQKDADVKFAISIAALAAVFLTLLVAALLTYRFVREKHNSAKAARVIARHCHRLSLEDTDEEEQQMDVQTTVNKLVLENLLEGTELLAWANSLQSSTSDSTRSSRFLVQSPQLYPLVDKDIRALPVDLTQYSDTPTARILRTLCEIPGIIDFVSVISGSDADLFSFVQRLSNFVEKAEEHHSNHRFPMHDLVKFEHRPLILYYLMAGTHSQRRNWRTLLDGILVANQLGSTHSRNGMRNRRHSVMSSCESSSPALRSSEPSEHLDSVDGPAPSDFLAPARPPSRAGRHAHRGSESLLERGAGERQLEEVIRGRSFRVDAAVMVEGRTLPPPPLHSPVALLPMVSATRGSHAGMASAPEVWTSRTQVDTAPGTRNLKAGPGEEAQDLAIQVEEADAELFGVLKTQQALC